MRQPAVDFGRRQVLQRLFWSLAAGSPVSALFAASSPPTRTAPRFDAIGDLGAPDDNGIRLPAGFSSRVVAVSGESPVPGALPWHPFPDGGACFSAPGGGWIYVSNSEVPADGSLASRFPELAGRPEVIRALGLGASGRFSPGLGGVGALEFDTGGTPVAARRILTGTALNCAGGATPWHTWLSCEEMPTGRVWECDPLGLAPAVARPALGRFAHEAVAVDPRSGLLYLTEDERDGRVYRFMPDTRDRLERGRLQALRVHGDADAAFEGRLPVSWVDVSAPEAPQRDQRLDATTAFRGGEGIWLLGDTVFFTTKRDNRVWALDTREQTLEIVYDLATAAPADRVLSGVDNLTGTAAGELLVAEDGGDLQICVIRTDRRVRPLLQVTGQDASEIAGPAFSPDGRRLYFSSQRGARRGLGAGITYEIRLPV